MTKRPNWPGLQEHKTRHGKIVYYVRVARGPRLRLRLDRQDPGFRAEYERVYEALITDTPLSQPQKAIGAAQGSLFWLWSLYNQSTAWRNLALSTRRQRENIMKHVLAKAGKAPISQLTRVEIKAGLDKRADRPSAANNYLSTMRHMFAWANDQKLVKSNPCDDVAHVVRPDTNGFPEWTAEDEAKFISRWPIGTRQYLAYMVHASTGLRRGDAVRLGRQHFKKSVITIQAEKNKVVLNIPVHPDLVAAIRACPPPPHVLQLLASSHGKPWGSKESYGNEFHDWAIAAGIAEIDTGRSKNSHGIRKLAATRLAEAGATEHQLMAIFGWTDPAMARVYTKKANDKKLAAAAGALVGASGVVFDLFDDLAVEPKTKNGK